MIRAVQKVGLKKQRQRDLTADRIFGFLGHFVVAWRRSCLGKRLTGPEDGDSKNCCGALMHTGSCSAPFREQQGKLEAELPVTSLTRTPRRHRESHL
jgi:hypothetical protein